MSIWGTIVGGATGLALGGAIGGLVGVLAGQAIDQIRDNYDDEDARKKVAFSVALIALSAKMAKSGGAVHIKQILAFREKVDIPEKDVSAVGKLWDLARQTPAGAEGYARQLKQLFGARAPIFAQLFEVLFHIARIDGDITPDAQHYLYQLALELGFDAKDFERIQLRYDDSAGNPYHILGVDVGADIEVIRRAWLALAREHHPDRLQADGLPLECIRSASERLASINAAYEQIKNAQSPDGQDAQDGQKS